MFYSPPNNLLQCKKSLLLFLFTSAPPPPFLPFLLLVIGLGGYYSLFWTYFYENEKRRPFDGGGKKTTWIDSARNVLLENNPDTWLRNSFSRLTPAPFCWWSPRRPRSRLPHLDVFISLWFRCCSRSLQWNHVFLSVSFSVNVLSPAFVSSFSPSLYSNTVFWFPIAVHFLSSTITGVNNN